MFFFDYWLMIYSWQKVTETGIGIFAPSKGLSEPRPILFIKVLRNDPAMVSVNATEVPAMTPHNGSDTGDSLMMLEKIARPA